MKKNNLALGSDSENTKFDVILLLFMSLEVNFKGHLPSPRDLDTPPPPLVKKGPKNAVNLRNNIECRRKSENIMEIIISQTPPLPLRIINKF